MPKSSSMRAIPRSEELALVAARRCPNWQNAPTSRRGPSAPCGFRRERLSAKASMAHLVRLPKPRRTPWKRHGGAARRRGPWAWKVNVKNKNRPRPPTAAKAATAERSSSEAGSGTCAPRGRRPEVVWRSPPRCRRGLDRELLVRLVPRTRSRPSCARPGRRNARDRGGPAVECMRASCSPPSSTWRASSAPRASFLGLLPLRAERRAAFCAGRSGRGVRALPLLHTLRTGRQHLRRHAARDAARRPGQGNQAVALGRLRRVDAHGVDGPRVLEVATSADGCLTHCCGSSQARRSSASYKNELEARKTCPRVHESRVASK